VAPSGSKDTPSMRQYHAAKAAYPDAIVFFRMGDFYEMFYGDAVTASRELELTLTSRNKGAVDEIPMAGVPHHAAHGYVARLIARGHKVAICEQMADPSKTRGIVPREVVRVITPGLVTDGEQLDARSNHFLAAVEQGAGAFGLALLDLSTGEVRAARLASAADLVGELVRAAPREVLCGPLDEAVRASVALATPGAALRDEAALEAGEAGEALAAVLGGEGAKAASSRLSAEPLSAAARALRFAARSNPGAKLPVSRVEAWDPRETLLLDDVAQRHLELVASSEGKAEGSLLRLLDATCTPPGARLLRRWLLAPLVDVARVRRRHDAVELFVVHAAVRAELRGLLERAGDLERLAQRASLGEASPKDLGALRDALAAMPAVAAALAGVPDPSAPEVLGLAGEPLDPLEDLARELAAALVERPPALARDGGVFKAGYSPKLDAERDVQSRGTTLLAELEARLRAETGITTLKVKYTRVFGWYLEITSRYLDRAPKAWRRKQTVAGAERFTSDELDELSDRVQNAEERAKELEADLYKRLVALVAKAAPRLHRLAARVAAWDAFAALAEVAHRYDYVRPEVDDGAVIDLVDSRHPVVERLAAAGHFVPNDVRLDADGERLWLVTGPNMAGKSTLMRQVALTVIMAQMGGFVPASRARVGVVDRVLSRVGASDNVSRGESTFMVEMRETAAILRGAGRRSLVILDEIGRGTSTYDGLAIAWAVAEHLHDVCRCRALFATHYHELTEFVRGAPHAANHSVSARELGDEIVFLHKLSAGAASRSYGIAVAKLAGLPEGVLARARGMLASLESGGALPTGGHASLRGRSKAGKVQLDLFAPPPAAAAAHPALETLASLDPERLTPLEALQLVAKLKAML
jgi:DNA mismatch repair protein MutS